jgi:hypothetical protein
MNKVDMCGVGAMVVSEDFGGMDGIWDDVSKWATNTYQQAITSAQTAATKAVTSTVQKTILKLTGADGQVKEVSLTPEQLRQYQASGTLPAGIAPPGFFPQQPSFIDQYQGPLIIAGIAMASIITLAIVYKAIKK